MGEQSFRESSSLSVAHSLGGAWTILRQRDERGATRSVWLLQVREGADASLVVVDDHGAPLAVPGSHDARTGTWRFSGKERFPWAPDPQPFTIDLVFRPGHLAARMKVAGRTDPILEWTATADRSSRRSPALPSTTAMNDDELTRSTASFHGLFGQVYRKFHAVSDPRAPGLSPEQLAVLHHLRDAGPMTVSEACEHFDRSQSSVSELFARLEKRGLVTRFPDERDRRRTLVWLSDEALTAIEHATAVLEPSRLAHALGTLSEEERRTLLALLQRVADAPSKGGVR